MPVLIAVVELLPRRTFGGQARRSVGQVESRTDRQRPRHSALRFRVGLGLVRIEQRYRAKKNRQHRHITDN